MATKKESDAAKKKKGNSWDIEKSISMTTAPQVYFSDKEKAIQARRKFYDEIDKKNEEKKAIRLNYAKEIAKAIRQKIDEQSAIKLKDQENEASLLAIRLKWYEGIKVNEFASQKEAETLNPREQEEILLPSVQTVYQYVKILGLPLPEILDKLNTEGYRCFVGSDLIPETRKILDNIYCNLQSDPKIFSEAEERRKEIEKIQVDLMKKASTSVNFSAPKITIWRGRMFCHKCGYSWNSTRTTPPGKCAKCGSQNILAIKQ